MEFPRIPTPFFGLQQQIGIQTMALMPRGFIVLEVQPESAAARGGIREGDVIEAIDGKTLTPDVWTFNQQFASEKKHTLSIVRAREKKQIVIETND